MSVPASAKTEDIRILCEGGSGRISLTRPRALNALTLEMCEAMAAALLEWRNDPGVSAVMLDHEGGRGFCAGGDVAEVRRAVLDGRPQDGRAFFRAEYRLNHLLFTYPKPVIAFMDGVTMGGGVGLALPAAFRIATENTLFAMPEGAIGFFPDVGAGHYLSRLPGRIGPFLALTGARLDGAECLWAGLATHYLPAESLTQAKRQIAAAPRDIEAILDALAIAPPPARLAGNAARIARLLAPDKLEQILDLLQADGSDWARKEAAAIAARSPTSARVALKLLARGVSQNDFAAEMALEYCIAARMIALPDFAEGVRAVLIDKDGHARWNPASAAQVEDGAIDRIFTPLPPEQEWTPLSA